MIDTFSDWADQLLAKAADDTDLDMIHKDADLIIEPVNSSARQLRFVISTDTVDRDGDVVSVAGWELDSYRRNPIVLFGHDQSTLPIGRVIDIGVEGNALKATVEFVPADVPEIGPRAEACFQLCSQGFMGACSVGFVPLAFELSDRFSPSGKPGLDISSAMLCELSLVNIPSNPDAMLQARSLAEAMMQRKNFIAGNIKARRKRRLLAFAQ